MKLLDWCVDCYAVERLLTPISIINQVYYHRNIRLLYYCTIIRGQQMLTSCLTIVCCWLLGVSSETDCCCSFHGYVTLSLHHCQPVKPYNVSVPRAQCCGGVNILWRLYFYDNVKVWVSASESRTNLWISCILVGQHGFWMVCKILFHFHI